MSNAEHLIENAIHCLVCNESFDNFSGNKVNVEMVKVSFPNCDIDNVLLQIWDMANCACYTWFSDETFHEQVSLLKNK